MNSSQIGLDKFIEALPVGIVILDSSFNVKTGNRLAFQLLDIALEDLLVDTFDKLIQNQKLKDALTQIQTESARKQEFFFENNNRYIKCTIERLYEESEENGIIVTVEDATKYRQLEGIKHDFIQTILHRLRSPLATLKTSLSIINTDKIGKISPEVKEILDMSYHEVNRLNVLLNDLRNLFVIETGLVEKEIDIEKFIVADVLNRAVKDFLKLQSHSEEIRKRLSLTGDINIPVKADFEKLKQILIILLKNAYTFSPHGTTVEINVICNDGQTTISVKDSGIGLSEKSIDFLFVKFFREDNKITRDNEGNGLGLFIARSLIELMKGTIYCESQKNKGSLFVINLPSE